MDQNNELEPRQPKITFGRILVWLFFSYLLFILLVRGCTVSGLEGDLFVVHLKEEAPLSMVDSTTPVKRIETKFCSISGNVVQVELVGRSVYIPLNNVSYVEVYESSDSRGR